MLSLSTIVSGYFFVLELSSFHINCGGSKVVVDGKTYEEDTNSAGPSRLFVSQTNWAFSNTEIMFTNDKTYASLGRRIFDVYVQGKQVLKDFNIEHEAGGVDTETIKKFTTKVTKSTLDIRFHWAGRGTTSIPYKGVYGSLISAISVNP
ncbi:unnamed protein product [Camellia sinensis]